MNIEKMVFGTVMAALVASTISGCTSESTNALKTIANNSTPITVTVTETHTESTPSPTPQMRTLTKDAYDRLLSYVGNEPVNGSDIGLSGTVMPGLMKVAAGAPPQFVGSYSLTQCSILLQNDSGAGANSGRLGVIVLKPVGDLYAEFILSGQDGHGVEQFAGDQGCV